MAKKDKTPLEIDRDFRRQIEASVAPPGYEKAATDKFLTPWLVKTVLIIASIALFAGFFVFIFGFAVRYTEAYDCAVETAKNNRQVTALLGAPVETGFFTWSGSYSHRGAVTQTSFNTVLSGSKASGRLYVTWYRSPIGSLMTLKLTTEKETHQIYSGSIPCR